MAIFDNHIHLRASFKGVEAAKAFEKAGGTAILLTHSPYAEVPITRAGDYEKAYGLTLAMADAVRAATHLQVFVALGPYPVEFIDLRETLGQEAAMDAMKRAIDLAATHIRERRAVAFGEIGRPHFPVDADSNARSSCIPRIRPRRRSQSSRQWPRGRGSTPSMS